MELVGDFKQENLVSFVCRLEIRKLKEGDLLISNDLQLEQILAKGYKIAIRSLEDFRQSVFLNIFLDGIATSINEKLLIVAHV